MSNPAPSEPSLNNKPVVDFNESDDRMWTSRATDQVAKWRDEGWTAIAVARYTAGPDGDSERLISSNGGNWFMGLQGQHVNRHFFEGWVDPGSNHDNNWHLFCVVHQGNSINADPHLTYDLGTPESPQATMIGTCRNDSSSEHTTTTVKTPWDRLPSSYHGMRTSKDKKSKATWLSSMV